MCPLRIPSLGWAGGPTGIFVLVPEGSCFHPPPVVVLALSLLDKSTQYSWEEGCWETLVPRSPMGEAWRWGQGMEWGPRLHSPGTGHPEGGQGRWLWGRSGPPRVFRDLDWGAGLNRSGPTKALLWVAAGTGTLWAARQALGFACLPGQALSFPGLFPCHIALL